MLKMNVPDIYDPGNYVLMIGPRGESFRVRPKDIACVPFNYSFGKSDCYDEMGLLLPPFHDLPRWHVERLMGELKIDPREVGSSAQPTPVFPVLRWVHIKLVQGHEFKCIGCGGYTGHFYFLSIEPTHALVEKGQNEETAMCSSCSGFDIMHMIEEPEDMILILVNNE